MFHFGIIMMHKTDVNSQILISNIHFMIHVIDDVVFYMRTKTFRFGLNSKFYFTISTHHKSDYYNIIISVSVFVCVCYIGDMLYNFALKTKEG